jgi:hypothetical protein
MNKEIIEEYNRMKKERDKLYVLMLNTQKGSGLHITANVLFLILNKKPRTTQRCGKQVAW